MVDLNNQNYKTDNIDSRFTFQPIMKSVESDRREFTLVARMTEMRKSKKVVKSSRNQYEQLQATPRIDCVQGEPSEDAIDADYISDSEDEEKVKDDGRSKELTDRSSPN